MVTVYFETPNGSYAEIVATFTDEKLFDACRPMLAGKAQEQRMILTESIDEQDSEVRSEIGIIASIISLSLFDEVKRFVNSGSIAAHEKIQEMAIKFEQEYRDVKDWSQFCLVNNVDDWEDFILEEVKREINK